MKQHPFCCQTINIRRLIKSIAINRQIPSTQIIDQDEYDVGLIRFGLYMGGSAEKESYKGDRCNLSVHEIFIHMTSRIGSRKVDGFLNYCKFELIIEGESFMNLGLSPLPLEVLF